MTQQQSTFATPPSAEGVITKPSPFKILVWQSRHGRVWVSYTEVSYIATRYAIPQALVGNIAGINGLVESVLHSS